MNRKNASHVARLTKRRDQILTTLTYVEEQRREVEQNNEWKDATSQWRRRNLLNELSHWYLGAMEQVEKALARITDDRYGFCIVCKAPVDPEWLDLCPETEFCAKCENARELPSG